MSEQTTWGDIENLGYDDQECNSCGRLRVEKYSDGARICEKCGWDQVGNYEV